MNLLFALIIVQSARSQVDARVIGLVLADDFILLVELVLEVSLSKLPITTSLSTLESMSVALSQRSPSQTSS